MVYIMSMYVNKRVELAQRGIALKKIYMLLLLCRHPAKAGGRESEARHHGAGRVVQWGHRVLQRHRGFHRPLGPQYTDAGRGAVEQAVHHLRLHHREAQRLQSGNHRGRL